MYAVIATSGRPDSILALLEAIQGCSKPDSFRGTLVIENGNKGDLENIINSSDKKYSDVFYFYSPVPNKSHALNLVLASLSEPEAIVFFTDDDAEIFHDTFEAYYSAAQEVGPKHFFGGPVTRSIGSPDISNWMIPFQPFSVTGWSPRTVSLRTVFLGINWAAFKSDMDSVGLFDERFGPGSVYGSVGQETNMQMRLIDAGVESVFVRNAVVGHRVQSVSSRTLWIIRRHFRGGVFLGLYAPTTVIDTEYKFDNRPELRVLDRSATPRGLDYVFYRLARPLVRSVYRLGCLKGWLLRRRGH